MTPHLPLRTLIADGSAAFSTVVKSWIDNRPELHWIGTVGTGPETIAAAESMTPDLVLLDAVLPEMDGFRVVRMLNRLPRPPLTVIVTFQASANARQAAFEAGAHGFIPKDEFAEGLDLLLPELLASLASGREDRRSLRGPIRPGP